MTADARWVGGMPERYDHCLGPALFVPYAEHVADLARSWCPARVLETAAGTGIGTAALVAALPAADVTATDLNPAMVEWARTQAPGATWLTADAQALGLASSSYDLVVCQFGAMFFPDRRRAYAEAHRVLVPGGRLVLTVWDSVETSELPRALVGCLQRAFPADPPTFLSRLPHGYADPEAIRGDLVAAGLHDVTVDRVALRGRPTVPAVYTEGMCLGSPLRFELEERGDLDRLTAQLSQDMAEQCGSEPVAGALSAFVATARAALTPAG